MQMRQQCEMYNVQTQAQQHTVRQQEDAYAELELRQAVFLFEQQSQPKTEAAEARDISPTAEFRD